MFFSSPQPKILCRNVSGGGGFWLALLRRYTFHRNLDREKGREKRA
jgi:hypothetical protein